MGHVLVVGDRKLLDKTSETELDVTYECLKDGLYGIVVVSRDEWVAMGEPEQITVMTLPGDYTDESFDPDLERSKRERGK